MLEPDQPIILTDEQPIVCYICADNTYYRQHYWLPGLWMTESDYYSFTHLDLPCIVHRGFSFLCGYIGIPPTHPLHGKRRTDDSVTQLLSVHGGLTDEGGSAEHHLRFHGLPENYWWFGFDCGHAGDIIPNLHANKHTSKALMELLSSVPVDHYWTMEEVIAETKRLARQLSVTASIDLAEKTNAILVRMLTISESDLSS